MNQPNSSPEMFPAAAEAQKSPAEIWEELQGGRPEVWWREGSPSCLIVHNYEGRKGEYPPGNGAIVPTKVERLKKKKTCGVSNGETITVPRALLWELHGGPCEQSSRALGNREGYQRIPVGSKKHHQTYLDRGYRMYDDVKEITTARDKNQARKKAGQFAIEKTRQSA